MICNLKNNCAFLIGNFDVEIPLSSVAKIMPSPSTLIRNDRIYFDEEVPAEALNRAFKYGDGLFETLLVRGGKAWKAAAHLDRMLHGMEVLGFEFDPVNWRAKMEEVIRRLIATKQENAFARIRIQVYRGGEGHYTPMENHPEYVAALVDLPGDPWDSNPPAMIGVFHEVPVVHSMLSLVKKVSALPYVVGARYAQRQGWDDAILRSVNGDIAESTRSNLFIFRNASVLTPHLKSGCLPGIMRATLLETARKSGFDIMERAVSMRDLVTADDIVLTNVIRGLVQVNRLAGTDWEPAGESPRDDLLHLIRQTD
jgi:branched-chain amino acid aminotransferase